MPKLRRPQLAAEAHRRNLEQLAFLGRQLREARARRRLTQQLIADAAGLSRSTVAAIELGRGGSHTLDAWQRLALATGRPLIVRLERDATEEPADAGHLAIQELVLRAGRAAGYARTFEMPSRPAEPWRSTDVGLRDDRRRVLLLVECWNTIGDVGAATRASARKQADAEALAVAIGRDRAHRVATCWVIRATRRNTELVRTYPEVFAARFPGSSVGWLRALTEPDVAPPAEVGLLWCDPGATRLYPWRRASG